MSEIRKAANKYFKEDGWNVIPITKDNQKSPAVKDLNKILLFPETYGEVTEYFKEDRNIAVATGPVSGKDSKSLGLIDIENIFLPQYERIISRQDNLLSKIVQKTRVSKTAHNGRHVYFYTDEPMHGTAINRSEYLDTVNKKGHIADIKGFKGYALCPPSLCDSPYLWENHNNGNIITLSIDEVNEVIRLLDSQHKPIRTVTEEEHAKSISDYYTKQFFIDMKGDISKDLFWYLQTGKLSKRLNTSEYWSKKNPGQPDRSTLEIKIIYRLVALGFTDKAIEQFFLTFAYKGSKMRERGLKLFRHNLNSAKSLHKKDISDFDKKVDALLNHSLYLPELKTYEKTVLNTILMICKRVGRFDNIQLSSLEIATRTGIAQQTASTNLKKLIEKEYLKIEKKSNGKHAHILSLNEELVNKIDTYTYINEKDITKNSIKKINSNKNIVKKIDSNTYNVVTNCVGITLNLLYSDYKQKNNDIYYRKGLNKTGFAIVQLLNSNIGKEFDVNSIAEITGISLPTVRKKLIELVNAGYVHTKKVKAKYKPKAMYWINEKLEDLTELAKTKGVLGKHQQHVDKVAQQREAYKDVLRERAIEISKTNGGEIPKMYWYLFDNEKKKTS